MASKSKEKEKKKVSKLRKAIDWTLTSIVGVILCVFAVFQFAGMANRDQYSSDMPPLNNYFGYHVMNVLTDSMAPEIPMNCSIIIKTIDDPSTVKIGDAVTFVYDLDHNGQNEYVTHEISDIQLPCKENGNLYMFQAHGTNKHSINCRVGEEYGDCTNQIQEFSENSLVGIVVSKSVFLGGLFNFLTQWYGLLIVLLIPTLYLIITSIIDIVKALNDGDDEDDNDDKNKGEVLSKLSNKDKERLKQELLDELMNKRKVNQ